jgi:hypothetical protein
VFINVLVALQSVNTMHLQLIATMSASSDFWNPTNTHCFHQQIVKLYAWNGVPTGPADYRCEKWEESSLYILSTAEEIHLADHIAFLAQRKSGAKYVSAATIEEHHDMKGEETEMRIRISANETPKLEVVTGLMVVMQRVEMYAAEGALPSPKIRSEI